MIIKGKDYKIPAFLPDATRAVIKSVDTNSANVDSVMVNTYHLINTPGTETIKKAGGVKKFMNFDGLVASDSGGWQVYSLISKNKTAAIINEEGIFLKEQKLMYSPEFCINAQLDIGADINICLDDYSLPTATNSELEQIVKRTVDWAKRCKLEFDRQCEIRELNETGRPLLMGVVQGGTNKTLRKQCYEALEEIGVDLYGWGGHTFDSKEEDLDYETAEYLASILPDSKLKFGLGLGTPYQIAKCASYGWDIFDCTLPTRDARHARLYKFKNQPQTLDDLLNKSNYEFHVADKSIFKDDFMPIDEHCDCATCQKYTRAYIYHLFKLKDTLAYYLATIHNIRVYTKVVEILRKEKGIK